MNCAAQFLGLGRSGLNILRHEVDPPIGRYLPPGFVHLQHACLHTLAQLEHLVAVRILVMASAKNRPVETHRGVDILSLQFIPDKRVGHVDQLGANMPLRLPQTDHRPRRVLDNYHSS